MHDITSLDIHALKASVGRETVSRDILTPGLLDRFEKTLGVADASVPAAGIHWCLAPPTVPMSRIGADGHPKKGDFLPETPLSYRMWASSAIEFIRPIPVGEEISRRSEILDISLKAGSAGPLVFADIGHTLIDAEGATLLKELQTLVFKGKAGVSDPHMPDDDGAIATRLVHPDPVLLFRYSALTFNGHRIHYDHPYATEVEGYPGIIVHGPLVATLLMHLALDHNSGQRLERFRFRGIGPAFSDRPLELAVVFEDENELRLEARGEDGRLVMKAEADFAE